MDRKRIFVGFGKKSADKAKLIGASKATCSRIRTGKQDFFFLNYHLLIRNKGGNIPITNDEFYSIIYRAINSEWPEADKSIKEDIAQEIAIRVLGLNSYPEKADKIIMWWGKRVTKSIRRQIKVRKRLERQMKG